MQEHSLPAHFVASSTSLLTNLSPKAKLKLSSPRCQHSSKKRRSLLLYLSKTQLLREPNRKTTRTLMTRLYCKTMILASCPPRTTISLLPRLRHLPPLMGTNPVPPRLRLPPPRKGPRPPLLPLHRKFHLSRHLGQPLRRKRKQSLLHRLRVQVHASKRAAKAVGPTKKVSSDDDAKM